MIINPVHPVAIVEKCCRAEVPVDQETVKPPIQSRWKAGILFIKVDEIIATRRIELMSSLPKPLSGSRFGELFSRKHQGGVATLVSQRHSVGKGARPCDPADVHPARLVGPCARRVEIFVTKDFYH